MRYTFWTQEEIEYFEKHYATSYTPDLMKQLGRSRSSLNARASLADMKKNRDFIGLKTDYYIEQYDYYTDEFIESYPNAADAADDNCIDRMAINYAFKHNDGKLPRFELKFKKRKKVSSCEKEPFRPKI